MTTGMRWEMRTLKLREIVLLSHGMAKELSAEDRVHFETMRAFNRGEIPEHEALAKLRPLANAKQTENPLALFEPMSTDGWHVKAGLYKLDGECWWLVGVTKTSRTVSPIEQAKLRGILHVLGGDIDRDRLSTLTLAELVRANIPFMWTWKNTFPLNEMQIKRGPEGQAPEDSRIVPVGTPLPEGYEILDFSNKNGFPTPKN